MEQGGICTGCCSRRPRIPSERGGHEQAFLDPCWATKLIQYVGHAAGGCTARWWPKGIGRWWALPYE